MGHRWSAERHDLLVSGTGVHLGQQSFHVAAPTVWNSLPTHLHSASISRGQMGWSPISTLRPAHNPPRTFDFILRKIGNHNPIQRRSSLYWSVEFRRQANRMVSGRVPTNSRGRKMAHVSWDTTRLHVPPPLKPYMSPHRLKPRRRRDTLELAMEEDRCQRGGGEAASTSTSTSAAAAATSPWFITSRDHPNTARFRLVRTSLTASTYIRPFPVLQLSRRHLDVTYRPLPSWFCHFVNYNCCCCYLKS